MEGIMKRELHRMLAASAAAAAGLLITLVTAGSPAEAACKGSDHTIVTTKTGGVPVAQERAVWGTCDGDGIYNGLIRDMREDGYAARIRYRDGSFNAIVAYASTGAWEDYRFYDQTGNNSAGYQLYANPAQRPDWRTSRGY